jgi:hypothetical protein
MTLSVALPAAPVGGDACTVSYGDVTFTISMTSMHYLPAAATMLGSDAKMWYEYASSTYAGPLTGGSCVGCHSPKATKHSFAAAATVDKTLFEGYADELIDAQLAYTRAAGFAVCWNAAEGRLYYDVAPANATDACGTEDTTSATFDAVGVRAAYNLRAITHMDPGAYAHNPDYVQQLVFDSITALGATPGFARQ